MSSEDEKRVAYCKKHNIHHLFELLATKVVMDRPEEPFGYLRDLLTSVEEAERNKQTHDPTRIQFSHGGGAGKKSLRKTVLGTFGLNNAGKTTLLCALGGEIELNTTPTVGFTPVQFQTEELDICIFDLGGAENFRGIWVHYFHDCHGVIYVVDAAGSPAEVENSLKVLQDVLDHPYVQGKPVLILANKKDLPGSRGEAVVPTEVLRQLTEKGVAHRVVATCGIREDGDVDDAVEWLLEMVAQDYEALAARVKRDCELVKEEKARRRAERLAALRAEPE